MQAPKTPSKPAHPLMGRGLHFRQGDGYVDHQASILAVIPSNSTLVGDIALVQYYEWVSGSPTNQRLLPLTELASRQWVLYASMEQANEHYNEVDHLRNAEIMRERLACAPAGPPRSKNGAGDHAHA